MIEPNTLILVDDLHWDEFEQKFVPLSEEEVEKIILNCIERNIDDDTMFKMIRLAERTRINQLLLDGFLNGRLTAYSVEQEEFPIFKESKNDENFHNDWSSEC